MLRQKKKKGGSLSHLVAIEMEGRQLEGLPNREGRCFWNRIMKGKACIPSAASQPGTDPLVAAARGWAALPKKKKKA